MSDKKVDAGYKVMMDIVKSPKGAAVFAVAAFAGYTILNKARNRTGFKVVVDFIERTADSGVNMVPIAK